MLFILIIIFAAILPVLFYLATESKGLRVLMYHKVSDTHTDFLTVTAAQLDTQLQYIRDKGYTFISLSDCIEHIEKGRSLPEKAVLLTFDDGYKNNITHAYPVLKKHEAKAAIFIVSSFTGNTVLYDGAEQSFMSIPELQSMQPLVQYGWHSFSHNNYAELTPAEVSADIQESKKHIGVSQIDVQPCLAYPYGAYPKKDKEAQQALFAALKKENISAAFRIGNRINPLPLRNRFLIERLDIRGDESFEVFKRKFRLGKIF